MKTSGPHAVLSTPYGATAGSAPDDRVAGLARLGLPSLLIRLNLLPMDAIKKLPSDAQRSMGLGNDGGMWTSTATGTERQRRLQPVRHTLSMRAKVTEAFYDKPRHDPLPT